jgi:N,N'-diacetyllegionaminate synthase
MRTVIIAEAGVNHNGDSKLAREMVSVAGSAGADYIKFQAFKAGSLASNQAGMAEYQKKNATAAGTRQIDMLRNLELDYDTFQSLAGFCKEKSIGFMSSAFDLESIELVASLKPDYYKIPSGEITNLPYLEKTGALNGRVILSTGMSETREIAEALQVLVKSGTRKENITLLHCNTEYPTPFRDVNLRAMLTLKEQFNLPVGYSDHTTGITVPVAAVALGASIIEKHFTLDKDLPGPDHRASLDPDELKRMISAVREAELALGSHEKKPSPSEKKNLAIVRKSIHARHSIRAGTILSEDDLVMKRPGHGISPMKMNEIIGKKTKTALEQDQMLQWDDLEN